MIGGRIFDTSAIVDFATNRTRYAEAVVWSSVEQGIVVLIPAAALPFSIGTATFRREPNKAEYVVLARAWEPAGGRPVFVLDGQAARTNLAAAPTGASSLVR